MPLNSDGIPQPSGAPSEKYKQNYEDIFGPRTERTPSGTFAMVDGELTRVAGGHGVESSSRSAFSSKKPQRSEALSVPAHQAAEFAEAAKRNKTGATFDKDGTCYLPSRGARHREMRAQGRYDKDAGYGDAAPKTF